MRPVSIDEVSTDLFSLWMRDVGVLSKFYLTGICQQDWWLSWYICAYVFWIPNHPTQKFLMSYHPIVMYLPVDSNKHCREFFYFYCQSIEDKERTNIVPPKTNLGILLGPTGNTQGKYNFLLWNWEGGQEETVQTCDNATINCQAIGALRWKPCNRRHRVCK